ILNNRTENQKSPNSKTKKVLPNPHPPTPSREGCSLAQRGFNLVYLESRFVLHYLLKEIQRCLTVWDLVLQKHSKVVNTSKRPDSGWIVKIVSQKERAPKVMATKICVVIRSFHHPNLLWGLPPSTRRIALPESQVLYTVLRSPHIDKKSREQFEMEIKNNIWS
ncbi:ribosomal protein S10, partial [Prunus dulcis]